MRYVIFIFAIIVLLQGCKKEELSSFLKNSWGWAKAEINSKNWDANACRVDIYAKKTDTISLILGRSDNIQMYEILRFPQLPLQLGKYILPSTHLNINALKLKTAFLHFMVKGDDDLDCAAYENLHDKDSLQNWVEITEYNEKTKEIKGRFSCNMILNPKGSNAGPKCKPTDPDTIRIRNGVFHTKIMN